MTARFRKEVRRKLHGFTRKVARVMSDTRRQRFVEEMIVGVVVSGKVHLTEVARAASYGTVPVHAAQMRLSRHWVNSTTGISCGSALIVAGWPGTSAGIPGGHDYQTQRHGPWPGTQPAEAAHPG
jgi:hypothetical protein